MFSFHALKNREKQLSVKVTQTRQKPGLLSDKYLFISARLFSSLPNMTPAPEEST